MRILGLLFSLTFFSFHSLWSQEALPCGTDEMHQQLFAERPDLNAGIIRANERLNQFTAQFQQQVQPKSDALYVIPIVFHIIHNYGVENISDAQVLDAVKQLNIQYRKRNADTTEIVNAFKNIVADPQIEFRLAQLDPDGNCTSGITRTVSDLTYIGDQQVKSLIHWPPNKYLNVYICAEAAGLAGHALLPGAADTIPEWDGIVMQHSYIGTFGTSEPFRRTVLSHEVGHFLNLQHIWGGNNVPGYYYLPVGQASNCDYDDEVSDTPLTIGWQTCNLSGESCGSLDNLQNYMEYSYCARMFTEGQKTRMHACLNSSVANRNNLWTESNRIATGTDDVSYYLCQAKWSSDKRIACVGEPIVFSDISAHGIETRSWNFVGGTASTLTDSVVSVSYATPGKYAVTLTVNRGTEQKSETIEEYIQVLEKPASVDFISENFENQASVNAQIIQASSGSPFGWEITDQAGYQSNKSYYFPNFEANTRLSAAFETPTLDTRNLSQIAISFDYAYASKPAESNELLQIAISNDCGQTWSVRKTLSGASSLKTVSDERSNSFFPANETEWNAVVISNIPASYKTSSFRVRFSFEARSGNNLFIDNIQIAEMNELSLPQINVADFSIFPNPSSEEMIVTNSTGIQIESYQLVDLQGKEVKKGDVKDTSFTLNLEKLQAGAYLLQLKTANGHVIQKVQKLAN